MVPLRAVDAQGVSHIGPQIAPSEWDGLRARAGELKLPCCDAGVVLARSPNGLQFFRHRRRFGCDYHETPHHLALKALVVEAATDAGWTASTEVPGASKDGERWIADVFCERGDRKIAFEVQWSSQAPTDYDRRQARYTQSGVRCIWLARCPKQKRHSFTPLLLSASVPAFAVLEQDGTYSMPQFEGGAVGRFVEMVLSGRVRRWPRAGAKAMAQVRSSNFSCRCGRSSRNLVAVRLHDVLAPEGARPVVDVDMDAPELLRGLVDRILPPVTRREYGELAGRSVPIFPFSNVNRSRRHALVNVCRACGTALVTEPYWIGPVEGDVVCELDLRIDSNLEQLARWFVDGLRVRQELPPSEPLPHQQ